MNIKYNEIDKSLEINDGIKKQYFYLNLLMILNLLNSFVRLYDANGITLGFQEYIWAILGIISLIALLYLNIKKSYLKIIPIKNIKRLNEKTVFGRKRFSFLLKNGKKRDLKNFKSASELYEFRKLLSEVGIQTE